MLNTEEYLSLFAKRKDIVQNISSVCIEDVFKLYLITGKISMDKMQNNLLLFYTFLSQFAMGK
jgi:hypothetical protein